MFKKPIQTAIQGDRLGICVTQFDAKLMERGIICTPGYANTTFCAIIQLNKIKYFRGFINSKAKYHFTIGHTTVLGTLSLFYSNQKLCHFNADCEYEYIEKLDDCEETATYFAVIEFDKPIIIVENSFVIASKLDMDIHLNKCRIAFWGKILTYAKDKEYKTNFLHKLKIYKIKRKEGIIDRVIDENSIIIKNMFKKTTNIQEFLEFKVELSPTGEIGKIQNTFGKSGKVKAYFDKAIDENTIDMIKKKKNDPLIGNENNTEIDNCIKIKLNFKKYIFDPNKRMLQ